MFIFSLVLILNMKKVMTNPNDDLQFEEVEFTNEEIKKCCKILFRQEQDLNYYQNDFYEARTIEKLIFEAILNKMTFPLKSKYNWPQTSNVTDYEITREELKFDSYLECLNMYDIKKVRRGKEAAIYALFRSISNLSFDFTRTINCINAEVKKINIKKLNAIVNKFIDLKMNEHYSFKVWRVFNPKDFKNIAEEINFNLGNHSMNTIDDINLKFKKINNSNNNMATSSNILGLQ
ncbi:uncharacterized protein VNE69_12117 [Vairimorpha necatrix]|uniref:Uncharacterized protein n=1 Tax=Vairimorpha necatrix TaxID=6039 RepID=A0AAX4JGV7_9MICR